MKENILFVILMTPLCLAVYNRINGIEQQFSPFETAFKEARQELGPNSVFIWNNNEYTTQYKEEL